MKQLRAANQISFKIFSAKLDDSAERQQLEYQNGTFLCPTPTNRMAMDHFHCFYFTSQTEVTASISWDRYSIDFAMIRNRRILVSRNIDILVDIDILVILIWQRFIMGLAELGSSLETADIFSWKSWAKKWRNSISELNLRLPYRRIKARA